MKWSDLTFDCTIIPDSALPDVRADKFGRYVVDLPDGRVVTGDPRVTTPERSRALGLAHLALSKRLAAPPPVDQAKVDALANHLIAVGVAVSESHANDFARRLVDLGVQP